MKLMQINNEDQQSPVVILAYDDNVTTCGLTEYIYTLLELACEAGGYKLKHDLYEMTEELEPV